MDKIIAIAIDEYTNAPEENLKNCLNDINSILNILNTDYEYNLDDLGLVLYSKPEQTTLSYLYRRLNEEFMNSFESDSILLIFAGHENIIIIYVKVIGSAPIANLTILLHGLI